MFRVNLSMPTDELFLSNVLTQNPQTRDIFRGVFSINELVHKPTTLPAAYIYNTLPRSSKSVGHWVCIYVNSDWGIEYFDSYGLRPPRKLLALMKQWSTNVVWNKLRFQTYLSNVCGLYVLYYIHFKYYGWSLQQIQRHFDSNSITNDNFVSKAIKSLITFL